MYFLPHELSHLQDFHCFLLFVYFFGGAGDLTQCLKHARHMLYPWTTPWPLYCFLERQEMKKVKMFDNLKTKSDYLEEEHALVLQISFVSTLATSTLWNRNSSMLIGV